LTYYVFYSIVRLPEIIDNYKIIGDLDMINIYEEGGDV